MVSFNKIRIHRMLAPLIIQRSILRVWFCVDDTLVPMFSATTFLADIYSKKLDRFINFSGISVTKLSPLMLVLLWFKLCHAP